MATSWHTSGRSTSCAPFRLIPQLSPCCLWSLNEVSESFPMMVPLSFHKKNTEKSINVIYHVITPNKKNHMILTRDSKKALDKIHS